MSEEEKIVARILDVLPPGSFELVNFLSVFRVRFSDAVRTACVTCGGSPELLLNRAFVETNCQSNEHLLMLVMHEIYHVILGHTTLFPHATPLRNLVFDAVINAILCTLFPGPEFTSFFTDLYPADKMPYALLRPPGPGTPAEAEEALRFLYGSSGTGTYHDVFEVLAGSERLRVCVCAEMGKDGKPGLLGSHDEEAETPPPALRDIIENIVSKWPSPNRPLDGRDRGSEEREHAFDGMDVPQGKFRRGVARLMRRASVPGPREVQCYTIGTRIVETASLVPDLHDRTRAARELLLGDALVSRSFCQVRQRTNRDRRSVAVYFDVSGSASEQVPAIARVLLPHVRRGGCFVQAFSTVVHAVSLRDLIACRFVSTGGTDIDCVLEHVLSIPARRRPHAIVVITDGFTGRPSRALAVRFRAAGVRLHVGLAGSATSDRARADLAALAESFVRLGGHA